MGSSTSCLAAALLLPTLAAAADCPAAGDLATGIELGDGNEVIERFTRLDDGTIQSLADWGGGYGAQMRLLDGVYLVEIHDLEEGVPVPNSGITYRLPLPEGGAPRPEAGGTWDVSVAKLDGVQPTVERQVYSFGPRAPVSIGACSYDAVTVRIAYPDDPEGLVETVLFLPDLGISWLSGAKSGDAPEDHYDYTYIRRVE